MRRRPYSQFIPGDLHVVAHIHRKGAVEQHRRDPGGYWRGRSQLQQLVPESGYLVSRRGKPARLRLDDDHRTLVPNRPDPHEGRATHVPVLVEDRLAGVGEQRAGCGLHPVALAPAVPDPALLVQVANIAHAVPPGVAVLDLGESAIPLAPKIFAGDDGAFDDQLADPAVWKDQPVVPGWERLVGDADDPQGDSRKQLADTGPFAGAGL